MAGAIAQFINGAIRYLRRPVESTDLVPIWTGNDWAMGPASSPLTAAGISAAGGALANGVFNFQPAFLRKWRKALGQRQTGLLRPKVIIAGDSTAAGVGAGDSPANWANARAHSFPTYLAALLTAGGIPAQANATCGTANAPDVNQYDPRVTLGSGWGTTAIASIGYRPVTNTTTTSTLAEAFTHQFDTVDTWYVQGTGNATFTINVDGGAALATVNSNGGVALLKQTVSTTLGVHDLNIQRNGTGTAAYISLVDAFDATANEVAIYNCGFSGARSADWADATAPYSPANAISTIAPALTIIDLGINDWATAVSLTSYRANIQAIITKAKILGDALLIGPIPSNSASVAVSIQLGYINVLKELALANDCPMIDMTTRFVSYAAANADGFYTDNFHQNRIGYADKARGIANVLLRT